VRVLIFFAVLMVLGSGPARAQSVTVSDTSQITTAEPEPRTPRGALLRAAAVPGWGQIYNRQYYKLPFVYAGLAGLIYGVTYMQDQAVLYRRADLYTRDPETYAEYEDFIAQITNPNILLAIERGRDDLLRQQRDIFKRRRDLFIFGVGLFYGLTMLDAFVSAHLRDFDVGETLSIQLAPGLLRPTNPLPTVTLRLRL
jgi:hypothetical protein